MKTLFLALTLLVSLPCSAGLAVAQTDWYVDAQAQAGGDGSVSAPFQSISDAITAADASGDRVLVSPGTYAESVLLDGKSLELIATGGTSSVIVDAGGVGSVLTIRNHPAGATTTARGFTLRGGAGSSDTGGLIRGGGLLAEGGARTAFEGCTFLANAASEGGGAYLDGGVHDFVDCTFMENSATLGGGLLSRGAEVLAANCRVVENTSPGNTLAPSYGTGIALTPPLDPAAPTPPVRIEFSDISRNLSQRGGYGGGLYAAVPVAISSTTFLDNARTQAGFTGGFGGGLSADVAGVILEDCEFRGNGLRMSRGGGVLGDVVATNCVFSGNQAAEGGGVYGGTYEDCLFEGNIGGGLCCAEGAIGGGAALATLTRCTLRGNQVIDGIALQGAGAFGSTLTDCLVEYNFQGEAGLGNYRSGGGIASCTATDTVIRGNSSFAGGGASDSTLIRCEITDNVAWEAGGGAVQSTLTECSILRNSAGEFGGGVAGSSTLERCVVAGNRASRVGGVAGSDVSFCTITGNTASGQVGGVGADTTSLGPFYSGFSEVRNSIVYANQPTNAGEISGTGPATAVLNAEWSVIRGGWPGTGNIDAAGQVVGPISGNAQLLPSSPAIDAANPAAPLDPNGTRADMGAIPFDASYVPVPTEFCTAKANGQGVLPRIGWSGSPTLSGPDDFTIDGDELNGQSFALIAAAPMSAYTAAFGGTICIGAGTIRLGVVATGGVLGSTDGTFSVAIDQARLASYGAGSLVYAQALVRDPSHPDGSGAALTAALEFRILP